MADRLDAALPADHALSGPRGWRTLTPHSELNVPHPEADGWQEEADGWQAEAVALKDLAGARWIAPPIGWSCEHVVLAACSAAGFQPDVRHRALDWAAVLALVGAGMGVALVPRLARLRAPEGVVLRSLDAAAPARHLFAACRLGAERHPAVATVLDALAAAAGASVSPPTQGPLARLVA